MALCPGIDDAVATTYLLKRLINLFFISTIPFEDHRRITSLIGDRRDEEMFRANIFIVESLSLLFRRLQQLKDTRRWVDLRRLDTKLGRRA